MEPRCGPLCGLLSIEYPSRLVELGIHDRATPSGLVAAASEYSATQR